MTNALHLTPSLLIDGLHYHGIMAWECDGPNKHCRRAHKEGRSWHVSPAHHKNEGRESLLVMPTYHYATVEEGLSAILRAQSEAVEVTSDEEWLRLEAEAEVPFRTRPGMRHPTRR